MTVADVHEESLAASLSNIARQGLDLSAVLTTVTTHQKISDVQAIAHCHHVALDGSDLPRLQDFTNEIANWLVQYVIPRTKLIEASTGSSTERSLKHERLRREAIDTFKSKGMSGEQGEMLMFVLAENFLKLPQILCKMDLKTDKEVHFHGVDGVHCGVGATANQLAIYWCESKVHADFDSALADALDGLKPFLLGPGAGEADKRRELALLDRYMDLGSANLQKQIVDSLNPHSPKFNEVCWRGVCLIGFDYDYPTKPHTKSKADFLSEVKSAFAQWVASLKTRTKNRSLETFEIHVFFLPLGFCEDFRSCMLKSLDLAKSQ